MGGTFFIVLLGVPLALVIALAIFLSWLFADSSQAEERLGTGKRNPTFLGKLFRWASRPVPKLAYRRDKRGRFRKVWRG